MSDEELQLNAQRTDLLASILGYNELAKEAESWGEKIYLRFARDKCVELYKELGGELDLSGSTPLIVVNTRFPCLALTREDVELMRKAIEEFDAREAKIG